MKIQPTSPREPDEKPKTTPPKLQPIPPQTVEAGKTLNVTATVENADAGKGKLQYGLASNAPTGAKIDPATGAFMWTPPDQALGRYDITVSAQLPRSQAAQTSFVVTVTRPTQPLVKEIAVDLGKGVKLEMILIPAGEFLMGSPDSDKDAGADERPQHRVRIAKPFYLGKYLVTQEQWQAVMDNNPSHFKGLKNPVECVSWNDCRQFLEKLNAKIGTQGGRFILPTEAQWEYACRAGSTTRYYFGDDESALGEYAWYDANSGNTTHPVGGKKPNAWGLYDMHGNVWEWCQDWYDAGYYAKSALDDPMGPATGSIRVFRGGDWRGGDGRCPSAYRAGFVPGSRGSNLGLRVSRVPAE